MIVRVAGPALPAKDQVAAVAFHLIGRDHVAGAAFPRVDADAFAVAAETLPAELSELARRLRVIRIGVPFVDSVAFVGVVDIAQLVIDGDGLDFAAAAEAAERADPDGADGA